MPELLTPKQVARALDVSESSVKRWCDSGAIRAHYTAGGHRRISLAAIREFLQDQKYTLVRPEALGLPVTTGQSGRVVHRAREQFLKWVLAGDERSCRQVVTDLYLASHEISVICDEVLAAALKRIGELWLGGEAEVYQERHACEITLRVLHELRAFLPPATPQAPRGIGGAPFGDQYRLGTAMAELVLRESGWDANSLGDHLPFSTFAAALQEHRPQLFWLSCSHVADEATFVQEYQDLYDEFGDDVAFVVGGSALSENIREQISYVAYCDNMQQLSGLSRTMLKSQPPAASS